MKKILLLTTIISATLTASYEPAIKNGAINAFMGTVTLQKGLRYYVDTKTSWLAAGAAAMLLSALNEVYQASDLQNPLLKNNYMGLRLGASIRSDTSLCVLQSTALSSPIFGLCMYALTWDFSKALSRSLSFAVLTYWLGNASINMAVKALFHPIIKELERTTEESPVYTLNKLYFRK